MHVVNRCLVVLPLPRHAETAAADLVASSLGLGIPVLPIETARTYAPGISMGTVAVFPAFSTPSPARGRSRRGAAVVAGRRGRVAPAVICLLRIANALIYCSLWRAWLLPTGAWLNGLTRLSESTEIERSLVRDSVDLFRHS
eukprot:COSAG02_NODE_3233_length_7129_cov_27.245946_4_plen_142_part_00